MDYKKLATDLLSVCEENCADCKYAGDSEFDCTIAELAATAITDLLARAESAEKRVEELEKSISDAAQVVKTMQESTIPFYERRAEKAQRERDAAIKQLREFTESVDRPCACCKHDTGDYVALDVCGGCSPENDKWEWDGGRDKK